MTEHAPFWFEGHVVRDNPIRDYSDVTRTRDQRIDTVKTLSDKFFEPSRSRDFEDRVLAHQARVQSEEQFAEEVADFPPVYKNGKRMR